VPHDLVAMSVEREAQSLAAVDQFASRVKFGRVIGTRDTTYDGVWVTSARAAASATAASSATHPAI